MRDVKQNLTMPSDFPAVIDLDDLEDWKRHEILGYGIVEL